MGEGCAIDGAIAMFSLPRVRGPRDPHTPRLPPVARARTVHTVSCPIPRKAALALVIAAAGMMPSGAQAEVDCFLAAAAYQHVSPVVLRAIAWQESHGNASAVHRNGNGSIDYGMMQINSVHLPALSRYGVSAADLMNPCSSVYVAAWHLHRMMIKYGNTWQAVGAYHSETPAERDRYARAIEALVERMMAPPMTSR
jgi:soluble lytic murein transglycosylase-like protein